MAFAPNYQRGQIRYTPIEEQLLAVCTALLQVETLTKKKSVTVRTSFPIKGQIDNTLYTLASAAA